MIRPLRAAALSLMWLTPALALDEPVVWRDPATGCGYFLTPQGGMAIRYRADGTIDCPDVPKGTAAAVPWMTWPRSWGAASTPSGVRWSGCVEDQRSACKRPSHQHALGKRRFQR
jgi:hypothetical protein